MKQTPPLPEQFTAKSVGNQWHLRCRLCNRGWSLPKNNTHPGNLLALLNHAHSHKENNHGNLRSHNLLCHPLFRR
jgi:hypothetical protein